MGYSTCTCCFFSELHQGHALFRVDEVHQAAAEQGDPVAGLVHLLIELGPEVPEGYPGDDRQAPEFVLLAEKEGQVAQETFARGQGLLGREARRSRK